MTHQRPFLAERTLASSTPIEGEFCACGANLFACQLCGDSRCIECDPYDRVSEDCVG